MKIIHTSDWHLGHLFYKHDRDDEFRHAISQLISVVEKEQPDALLVSGDIFDTPTPSTSAQQIYHQALLGLHAVCNQMPIVIIAGNHDGKSFLDVSKDLWQLANVHVVGLLDRKEDASPEEDELLELDEEALSNRRIDELLRRYNIDNQLVCIPGKGFIVAIPHIYDAGYPLLAMEYEEAALRRQHYFTALLDAVERVNQEHLPVVVAAHLALSSGDCGWHEWGALGGLATTHQAEFGNKYDYLALGHIHKQQTLTTDGRIARYCGSLLPISFSETGAHGVSIVQIEPGIALTQENIRTVEINPLRPLVTMPQEPQPYAKVLSLLDTVDPEQECYLRLQVKVSAEEPLPPDAMAQVIRALEGRKARFCEFKISSDVAESTDCKQEIYDPSQLREMTPMQVAQYAQQGELPDLYKEMFEEVCRRISNSEQ